MKYFGKNCVGKRKNAFRALLQGRAAWLLACFAGHRKGRTEAGCFSRRFLFLALPAGLLLLGSGCYNDKPDFCLQDGVKYWGCHAAVLELSKPPCPPPLVTLQPGLQTLNTGGSNYSVDFRFPQVNGLRTCRITLYEKTGQEIWLQSIQCGQTPNYRYYEGSNATGQTELLDVLGDNYILYTYYVFTVVESGGNYEIQFTIPSAPL